MIQLRKDHWHMLDQARRVSVLIAMAGPVVVVLPSSARATTNESLEGLAVLDSFGTNESPLSGGGNWSALSWANGTSGHNTGRISGGWGPSDAYPVITALTGTKRRSPIKVRDRRCGHLGGQTRKSKPVFLHLGWTCPNRE